MNKIQFNGKQYCVILTELVVSTLREYEQNGNENEAGGILLGKVGLSEYQTNIAVTDITTPTEVDYRSRFRFIRRKEPAQKIINEKWKESGGKVNYLGEWHTHPEHNPIPSSYDEKMIEKTNRKVKSDLDFTLLLIAGKRNSLWVGVRKEKELITLS